MRETLEVELLRQLEHSAYFEIKYGADITSLPDLRRTEFTTKIAVRVVKFKACNVLSKCVINVSIFC